MSSPDPIAFVVIKGYKVIGDYSTREDALAEAQKNYPIGTFLIQLVSDTDEEVQRFHSRVAL